MRSDGFAAKAIHVDPATASRRSGRDLHCFLFRLIPNRVGAGWPSSIKSERPMTVKFPHAIPALVLLWQLAPGPGSARAQSHAAQAVMPRVVVPTGAAQQPLPAGVTRGPARNAYPWKTHITATIFWIGEQPTANNPTPNCKSSWDVKWSENFGGYDNPAPEKRIACHTSGTFRPAAFAPRLNPFYIALPYNDVMRGGRHKPEAPRVIPWFNRYNPQPGHTMLKGRWLQLHYNGRTCFAQWEDCGPWVTDDWEYVFGDKRPKATRNNSAGIDISPAVRDYLGIQSHQRLHWRFVEDHQVPNGPWMRFGPQPSPNSAAARLMDFAAANPPLPVRPSGPIQRPGPDADIETQRRYLEYLRQLRDESFQNKPLRDLQR